jgi:Protein of unknown function (DUF2865)
VVQAEDSGIMNFLRQNTRPIGRSAPTQYYTRQAPAPQYAPQSFFPRIDTRRAPVAAAYAPYVGYVPLNGIRLRDEPRRQAAGTKRRVATANALTLPAPNRASVESGSGFAVGRTAYCVRTCDGFFFPLSGTNGSASSEDAACRRLCPTAEVKVYVSNGRADIEDARNRETGRRYAQMANALSYRRQADASCTCSANGVGLTNLKDALRDPSLRRGDVVMTSNGMRVFADGGFVGIEQSRDISAQSRELLRRVQNASLPGRSGITAADVRNAERQVQIAAERRNARNKAAPATEATDLSKASAIANRIEAATIDGRRYVGPDMPTTLR